MPAVYEQTVSALLVGRYEGDRALVRKIFREHGWQLNEVRDLTQAMGSLAENPSQVVIVECPAGGWQQLLTALRSLPHPPQLIVTSRMADDFLWSEVLNQGGFDVLPQPLEREEVERVVAAAGRQFRSARSRLRSSAA